MSETVEFETSYEELELFYNDEAVGVMWLISIDGKRLTEHLYYPPQFMPKNGRYLSAPYSVRVSISDERLPVSPSIGATISVQQFEGLISGFEFDAPAFKLSNLSSDEVDIVAQIQLHPEHLPDWLGRRYVLHLDSTRVRP
ncbi:hypothetical protein [Natrinema salinisoli]|uniref:hypothetical protein n=1 Tax=Natrinema salinisoli TaxID=2878535 RepID=UPI001CF05421|nr:hypothetical protein [Natrinema salinisoli]